MYNNAIVVMSRFEDEYLLEWIFYHKLIGIEHIFYYDNGNLEPERNITKKILQPFIDEKFITYIPWGQYNGCKYEFTDKHLLKHNESKHLMWCAYDNTIKMKPAKWLIGIDMDEFIVLSSKYKNINEFLDKYDYNQTKMLIMKSFELGNNNYEYPKYNLITESYTFGGNNKEYGRVDQIKSIINTSLHNYCGGVHNWGIYNHGSFPEKYKFQEVIICDYEDIKFNHYFCKSKWEWKKNKQNKQKSIEEIEIKCIMKSNFNCNKELNHHVCQCNFHKCSKICNYILLIKSEINKYYYGNHYTPSNISINQIIDYLNNNTIEYFIVNHSLLGAFRNNYLLPNNLLLEICVNIKNNDKEKIEKIKDLCIINYFEIDNENSIIYNNIKLNKEIVFPINKIKLNNNYVNCPIDIYKFLLKTGFNIHK